MQVCTGSFEANSTKYIYTIYNVFHNGCILNIKASGFAAAGYKNTAINIRNRTHYNEETFTGTTTLNNDSIWASSTKAQIFTNVSLMEQPSSHPAMDAKAFDLFSFRKRGQSLR